MKCRETRICRDGDFCRLLWLPVSGLLPTAAAEAEAGRQQVEQAITEFFGEERRSDGRVAVSVPAISENGYSVPLSVAGGQSDDGGRLRAARIGGVSVKPFADYCKL